MTNHFVHNSLWQGLLLISLLGLFALPVQAAIPDNVDYQGFLTDSGGSPINGTVDIKFNLYNVETGGIGLWSEKYSVTVTNGLFSIQLGRAGGTPFPAGMFDDPLWLGIDVSGDGEMAPRIAFSSAAFAHKADDALTLEGQAAASLDQSAHVIDMGNPHGVNATQAGAVSSANFSLHISNASAHHTKTSSFTELGDQASDAQLPATIARDSEIMPMVFANDGPGSTLNADLLDGLNSSAFMSSGTDNWVNISGDTMTGNLGVLANVGIGTATPALVLDVRGGVSNYLVNFYNDNNSTGNAHGLNASGNARGTVTGLAIGGSFTGWGGSDSGSAYGTRNTALAHGTSEAIGVYSDATGGSTTGMEYAFYGLGHGYFSENVGIGTMLPGYALDVRGGTDNYLGYFKNDNNSSGSTYGIYARGDAYGTATGQARGGYFSAMGGSTSGNAYGTMSQALAYGSSTAYGIFSEADGGSTSGMEYAFFGYGDGFFSGDVGIGAIQPAAKLEVQGGSSEALRITSDTGGNSHFAYGSNADLYLSFGSTGRTQFRAFDGSTYSNVASIDNSGNIRAVGYQSSDGSQGMTTMIFVMSVVPGVPCSITVKDGLITDTTCLNP